jgi:hypothetical protein
MYYNDEKEKAIKQSHWHKESVYIQCCLPFVSLCTLQDFITAASEKYAYVLLTRFPAAGTSDKCPVSTGQTYYSRIPI